MFEVKTVKAALKVLSTFIDWNEISLFGSCTDKIKEFLSVKHLRAGAFHCLGSIVGKGMPVVNKIQCITHFQFLELLQTACFDLLNDYDKHSDTDDYEEEKHFMEGVSVSVSNLGKWCLSVISDEEKMN